MAKQGNFAAYRELTNTPDTITRDIQYWNEDAARRRQERQAADNEMYDREQKAKAEKKALYDQNIKPQNAWDTGSSSLNEVIARAISNATEQFAPAIEILETEPPGSEKYIKAQMKLANLGNFADNMKLFTDKLTERNALIMSEVEKGNIDDDDVFKEYKKSFQNGWDTFQVGIDENGLPVIAYADKDGDGQNDYTKIETFDNIKNGISEFKFNKKYNPDAMAKDVADKLKPRKDVTQKGFTTTTTEGFDQNIVDAEAKRMIVDGNSLTEAGAYILEKTLKLEDTGENRLKAIEYMKDRINIYDEVVNETKIDQSGRTSRMREDRLRAKDQKNMPKASKPVAPSDEIWDFKTNNIDPNAFKSLNVSGVSLPTVSVKNLKTVTIGGDSGKEKTTKEELVNETFTDADINNIIFNRNGDMVIDFTAIVEKGGTNESGDGSVKLPDRKTRGTATLQDEDAAAVADQLGTTVEELKQRTRNSGPALSGNADVL